MPHTLPVTANTEKTKPENRAFYPALDGLRAVALLMVVFWHYDELPWGWAGVNIFFVLSGFLITGILYDSRDHPHRVRNFYVRRTLRIFPLYYGILLALLLVNPLVHWQWSLGWLMWPAYVANFAAYLHPAALESPLGRLADGALTAKYLYPRFTLHIGHFWTLCVEEQFYLAWPCVVFLVKDRRKLMGICATVLPLCLVARIIGSNTLPQWMLDRDVLAHMTLFRIDDLMLGGLVALILRGSLRDRLLRVCRAVGPYVLVSLLLVFAFTPLRHLRQTPYPYPAGYLTFGLTAIGLLSALLIAIALQPGTLVYRVLTISPLRAIGRISYGAYVWHDIFHEMYFRRFGDILDRTAQNHAALASILLHHRGFWVGLMSLAPTFLLSWLSFRFFESQFLNLKERWTIR